MKDNIGKNRLFLLLKYLWRETDENHYVTIKDIQEHLETEYGISADRKTLYADIAMLESFGLDLDTVKSRQNKYAIISRVFETAEIKLLVDAVQASKFINKSKSKSIINKLALFTNDHQKDIISRQLYVEDLSKSDNSSIIYTIDDIHYAIQHQHKISFNMYEYCLDKSKRLKHYGQVYYVSPYALAWHDDNYYVIGYSDSHKKIVKFRVDRITNCKVTDVFSTKRPADFSVSKYFTKVFSMFDGKVIHVSLICANELISSIIDKFGEDVRIVKEDDTHFRVTTEISISPMFFSWVFASGGKMKIASPVEVIDEFNKMLEKYKEV